MTALGTWTELRHDTILYAKQTYATVATSAPGGSPEQPRGYVEPNLRVWERLSALETLTRNVLQKQNVLSANTKDNLDSLSHLLGMLLFISRNELGGQPLTEAEYGFIRGFGDWLDMMRVRSSYPAEPGQRPGDEAQQTAAIVADVATDPNSGQVLEEGTGFIQDIYAVVPDGKGKERLVRGGVYSPSTSSRCRCQVA